MVSTPRRLFTALSLLLFLGLIWLWLGGAERTPPSSISPDRPSAAMDRQGEPGSPIKELKSTSQRDQLSGNDDEIGRAPDVYPTPENPKELPNGWKVARGPLGVAESRLPRTWHFDVEKLKGLGFADKKIDRVYAGWEEAIAARGPFRAKGHDSLLSQNESPMRDEMGDADYDAALYAAGIENRVVIKDVGSGGPAETAGIMPGDRIITYNGERVFGMREFSFVLKGTEPRDLIDVLVQHPNGELEEVKIPGGWAGPGFELDRSSEPPP